MSDKKKEMNFEQSLEMLQEYTEKIQAKETNLEDSIQCYEEGMKYYEKCKGILQDAEQKILTYEGGEMK